MNFNFVYIWDSFIPVMVDGLGIDVGIGYYTSLYLCAPTHGRVCVRFQCFFVSPHPQMK
jgi:hypothetical protein